MTTNNLAVGFVAIARTTFDIPLATTVTEQARANLQQTGLTLTGPTALVTDLDMANEAAAQLAQETIHALVIFQATFADSTMIMALAEQVDVPLLLWAVPDEITGGMLRLNSLCGINLGGHALTNANIRYDYSYAPPGDSATAAKIRSLAQAGQVIDRLRHTRIGRFGEHPDGFSSCAFNDAALKALLGVEVVQQDLDTLFAQVRATAPAAIDAVYNDLSQKIDGMADLEQEPLRGTLGVYLTLQKAARQEKFDGLAVRCWPQFFTELGCAACGALGLLNDEMIPAACETDINGAITELILQWSSGEPAFGTDMVHFDMVNDTAILWHCGKAPLAMADPAFRPRSTIHNNRKKPFLLEFPLKPGRVTIARLHESGGDYHLVLGGGEMLRSEPSFSGTSGVIRFDNSAQTVLDTIMGAGLEHHIALTYGDHSATLETLAELLGLPILSL